MVGGAIMSLVLELQQQSIESNSDVLSLLRKALLVAHKLGLKDFEEWIIAELNGYQNGDKIPNYRKVSGEIKGKNPYNGVWMPVIITSEHAQDVAASKLVTNSIGDLYAISKSDKEVVIPMTSSENIMFSKNLPFQAKFELFISSSIVNHIIEQVKTNILNWTLILEEKGILGEGMSFSQEEKNKAKSESQIVNYISNFYGDMIDSQFQQGTSKSSQHKK